MEFIIKKVLKRKGDDLYVNWKVYDTSFNSWTSLHKNELLPRPRDLN